MRAAAIALACLVALAGCGGGGGGAGNASSATATATATTTATPPPSERAAKGEPVLGQRGDEKPAGPALGFPVFATKNTTRVGGADPVADAAGVAQAIFPSR